MTFLDGELTEAQKKKVEMICDKILELNVFELRYMTSTVRTKIEKSAGINPLKLNLDWPSVKMDGAGTWPPTNPNWFK